jgi:hypothetical protein
MRPMAEIRQMRVARSAKTSADRKGREGRKERGRNPSRSFAVRDQGQTIFAKGALAYDALPSAMKARIDGIEGLHCCSAKGRSRDAVLKGETPPPLKDHERPQRQALARIHPVTDRRALHLCESGQMDFLDGPLHRHGAGPAWRRREAARRAHDAHHPARVHLRA